MTPAARKTTRKKPATKRRRKANPSSVRAVPWILGAALVVLACGIGLLKWSRTDGGQAALLGLGADRMHADVQLAVEHALRPVLPGLRPGPAAAASDHDRPAPELGEGAEIRCRVVPVPAGRTWWQVQAEVDAALENVGARVLWGERLPKAGVRRGKTTTTDEDTDLLRLDLGVRGHPTHTLLLHREDRVPTLGWDGAVTPTAWQELADRPAPTVALVIDDWGYGRNSTTSRILALDTPLTLAVIPGESFSRHFALKGTELMLPTEVDPVASADGARSARRLAGCPVEVVLVDRKPVPARRREIMLHMPMQPQSWPDTDPGPRAVMVGMDQAAIGVRLDEALAGLPGVRGVNNHMGSAATSDAGTMTALMKELRHRGLYFVDSLTSARSVGYDTARQAGVPAERNRIFLDYDNENAEAIRTNLGVLVNSARRHGFAVGIGHPHAVTAEVLERELPRLRAAGIRFVTVSELMALRRLAGEGAS